MYDIEVIIPMENNSISGFLYAVPSEFLDEAEQDFNRIKQQWKDGSLIRLILYTRSRHIERGEMMVPSYVLEHYPLHMVLTRNPAKDKGNNPGP